MKPKCPYCGRRMWVAEQEAYQGTWYYWMCDCDDLVLSRLYREARLKAEGRKPANKRSTPRRSKRARREVR